MVSLKRAPDFYVGNPVDEWKLCFTAKIFPSGQVEGHQFWKEKILQRISYKKIIIQQIWRNYFLRETLGEVFISALIYKYLDESIRLFACCFHPIWGKPSPCVKNTYQILFSLYFGSPGYLYGLLTRLHSQNLSTKTNLLERLLANSEQGKKSKSKKTLLVKSIEWIHLNSFHYFFPSNFDGFRLFCHLW